MSFIDRQAKIEQEIVKLKIETEKWKVKFEQQEKWKQVLQNWILESFGFNVTDELLNEESGHSQPTETPNIIGVTSAAKRRATESDNEINNGSKRRLIQNDTTKWVESNKNAITDQGRSHSAIIIDQSSPPETHSDVKQEIQRVGFQIQSDVPPNHVHAAVIQSPIVEGLELEQLDNLLRDTSCSDEELILGDIETEDPFNNESGYPTSNSEKNMRDTDSKNRSKTDVYPSGRMNKRSSKGHKYERKSSSDIRKVRFSFSMLRDVALLKTLIKVNPWMNGENKWDEIAETFRTKGWDITTRTLKGRLKILLQFSDKSFQCATEKERTEKAELLEEVRKLRLEAELK